MMDVKSKKKIVKVSQRKPTSESQVIRLKWAAQRRKDSNTDVLPGFFPLAIPF